jgi:hypothetical protein
MRWLDADSLLSKKVKKDGQIQLLKAFGFTAPTYFIERFDYADLGDFLHPHRMLTWVRTESKSVINLEGIDPPEKKNKKFKAMKARFPNTAHVYNYRDQPPEGLYDPNHIGNYGPNTFLMQKELGFTFVESRHAKEQARRQNIRKNRDPSDDMEKIWVGNVIHTSKKEFDQLTTLHIVRNLNLMPDKFPYILKSFGDFVKNVNSGSVNILMKPLEQASCWHISAAKDSLFEGVCEWLEAVLHLVSPENLNEEQLQFWKETANKLPVVVDGYEQLHAHVKSLSATKPHKKLTQYKLVTLIFDLIQNFPLKNKGDTVKSRLTKLPPRDQPNEFPEVFRKGFQFNTQTSSRFQAHNPKGTKGKTLSPSELQQYTDLRRNQAEKKADKAAKNKTKNANKRKRKKEKAKRQREKKQKTEAAEAAGGTGTVG